MQEEFSQPEARPARPRLTTWLLLLVLALVAWGVTPQRLPDVSRELQTVQALPPPVVEATGQLAEVYREARPAVVRIESHCAAAPRGHAPVGTGTGFFISDTGQLLTAYHVVRSQSVQFRGLNRPCRLDYRAVTLDGDSLGLELIAFDAVLDVALLQADIRRPVQALTLSSSLPYSGHGIVAIGNSRDEFLKDRAGTVLRRNVTASQVSFASGTIETTASLAPGDSGGPLLNAAGEVVGVVSYISYVTGNEIEEQGLIPRLIRGAFDRPDYTSYAVPVLVGGELHERLLAGISRDIPVIGFQLQFNYTPAQAGGALGASPGVVVGPVQPGGPGDRAGLRSYQRRPVVDENGRPVGSTVQADVIVALNGFATPDFDQLLALIYEYDVGDTVTLTVQRGGTLTEIPLELAARRDIFPQ